MSRRLRYVLFVGFICVLIVGGIFVLTQPITFRPSLTEELMVEIISVNGEYPSGIHIPRESSVNATIEVEVTYDHWRAVEDATVEIFGVHVSDSNTTNSDGIAILHLHVAPQSTFYNHGYGYLSMRVWKDKHLAFVDDAIRVTFGYSRGY